MQRIAQAARTMLADRLLPFWKSLRDGEYGGYCGYMDFDLRLDRQAEKGCIQPYPLVFLRSRYGSEG